MALALSSFVLFEAELMKRAEEWAIGESLDRTPHLKVCPSIVYQSSLIFKMVTGVLDRYGGDIWQMKTAIAGVVKVGIKVSNKDFL